LTDFWPQEIHFDLSDEAVNTASRMESHGSMRKIS